MAVTSAARSISTANCWWWWWSALTVVVGVLSAAPSPLLAILEEDMSDDRDSTDIDPPAYSIRGDSSFRWGIP